MQPTADNIFYVLAQTIIKKNKNQEYSIIKSNKIKQHFKYHPRKKKILQSGQRVEGSFHRFTRHRGLNQLRSFPKLGVKTPRINTKRWRRKKKRSVFYAPIPLRNQKDTKITINPSPVMSSCILTISLNRILVYFWEVWVTTKMLNITATAGSFTQLFRAPEW